MMTAVSRERRVLQQAVEQRGLAGAEEAGEQRSAGWGRPARVAAMRPPRSLLGGLRVRLFAAVLGFGFAFGSGFAAVFFGLAADFAGSADPGAATGFSSAEAGAKVPMPGSLIAGSG